MKYTQPSFTVPTSETRKDPCVHGWLDPKGKCVLCGEGVPCGATDGKFVCGKLRGHRGWHTQEFPPGTEGVLAGIGTAVDWT